MHCTECPSSYYLKNQGSRWTLLAHFVVFSWFNNLFPARQSAYRHHYSTETAMVIVHSDIVQAVNRGQLTALVLLDLSSAFDTVDQDLFDRHRVNYHLFADDKQVYIDV